MAKMTVESIRARANRLGHAATCNRTKGDGSLESWDDEREPLSRLAEPTK